MADSATARAASDFDPKALRVAHSRALTAFVPTEDAINPGLTCIEHLTGHLMTGSLVVLNGPTGGGKTTALLSMALSIPLDPVNRKIGVDKTVFLGLEMSTAQQRSKLICGKAGIAWKRWLAQKSQPLTNGEIERFNAAYAEWMPIIEETVIMPDVIHGGTGAKQMTVERLCAAIAHYGHRGIRVLFVDPLKLLSMSGSVRLHENEDAALRAIHRAAVKANVLVIIGNQMTKAASGTKARNARLEHADFGGSAMYKEIAWHFLFIRRATLPERRLSTNGQLFAAACPESLEVPGLMVLEKAKDRGGSGAVTDRRYVGFRDGLLVDLRRDTAERVVDEYMDAIEKRAKAWVDKGKQEKLNETGAPEDSLNAEALATRTSEAPSYVNEPYCLEWDGRYDEGAGDDGSPLDQNFGGDEMWGAMPHSMLRIVPEPRLFAL